MLQVPEMLHCGNTAEVVEPSEHPSWLALGHFPGRLGSDLSPTPRHPAEYSNLLFLVPSLSGGPSALVPLQGVADKQ